jgi:hypothetical protein
VGKDGSSGRTIFLVPPAFTPVSIGLNSKNPVASV